MSEETAKSDDPSFRFDTLREAVHGCDTAKEELFTAARRFLAPIARRELDSAFRVRVAESDLIQDTLVLANAGLGRFKGSTDREFAAWLRSIFVNCMLNHYRANCAQKRAVSHEKTLSANLEVESEVAFDAADNPSRIAIANEEQELLRRGMSQLSPEYQEVLKLRHQERLRFEEIGHRMDKSSEAARKLWYRAFKELTRIVKRDMEQSE